MNDCDDFSDDIYLEQQRLERRQEAFGDGYGLFEARFEFDNGLVPQMEQARRYVENWKEMREKHLGLLFWGQPGNGKTFAAACIANALLEMPGFHKPTVKMTTFGKLLNKLPGMSAQDKEGYINGFLNCDLLILDDFGMERRTDYAREQVFNLIDGRYLARKPLIVTTNLSLDELSHPTDMVEKRIYDRVRELCVPVCFDGESLRQAKAKERLQLYKQITGQ